MHRIRTIAPFGLATLFVAQAVHAAPGVTAFSYFGGSGDDIVLGVAIASDGSIIVAGTTTSPSLGGSAAKSIQAGMGGFVAKLDSTGTKISWVVQSEPASGVALTAKDEPIVQGATHLLKLASDGSSVMWTGTDVAGGIAAFAQAPDGHLGILSGSSIAVFGPDGKTKSFDINVGRDHVAGLAIGPNNDVYASGDTNTSPCGPWRSPFVFRYDPTGKMVAKLYDFPGSDPNICMGKKLLADSSVRWIGFDPDGTLWLTGTADGGNTVFTQEPTNLANTSPALTGACYSTPCYGWKGASKPGFAARVKPDLSDIERGTFIVAHFNDAPVPCTCDVPNPAGATRSNAATFDRVLGYPGGVVGVGGSAYHFPLKDPWFPKAMYGAAGTVVGLMDRDMKTMTMATLVAGTSANHGSAYRGGRLVLVGAAKDPATVMPIPADATVAIPPTPAASPLQPKFAGGMGDGYVLVACLTTDAECGAPPAPNPVVDAGALGGTDGGAPSLLPGADGAPLPTGGDDGGTGTGSADAPGTGVGGDDGGGGSVAGDGGVANKAAGAPTSGCGCQYPGKQGAAPSALGLLALGAAFEGIRRRNKGSARTGPISEAARRPASSHSRPGRGRPRES